MRSIPVVDPPALVGLVVLIVEHQPQGVGGGGEQPHAAESIQQVGFPPGGHAGRLRFASVQAKPFGMGWQGGILEFWSPRCESTFVRECNGAMRRGGLRSEILRRFG